MKKMYKIFSLGIIFSLLNACDFSETNINPNNPVNVPIGTILIGAEAHLAYTMFDDVGRMSGILTQQIAGSANQSAVNDQYNITESDINSAWSNFYQGVLNPSKQIIIAADESGSPHMSGVAKVLQALTLGILTDSWGDIPWSEALQGSDNLKPVFDEQEFIYSEIQRLLNEAIAELSAEQSAISPNASSDRFYGGDVDMWIAAAYTAKAKYYNNLSEVDPQGSATSALQALQNGFTSNAENMVFEFIDETTGLNPVYDFFNISRVGDASLGKFYVDELSDDPRLPVFVGLDGNDERTGAPAGEAKSASGTGTLYSQAAAPVFVLTYAEAKFIEAEAHLRLGNTPEAENAYQEAIRASMEQYDVEPAAIDDYLAANGSMNGLNGIITEKYISLFANPQAWTDYRRTGYPNISPSANNVTNNEIPTKLPYPSQERTNNGENVNVVSDGKPGNILAKVWWDK